MGIILKQLKLIEMTVNKIFKMKKLLFIILLTLPILGFSQGRTFECNCKENNFRQIFEIDLKNQTIKRISSMNTETGEVYPGDPVFNNVFWKNDFIYFLIDKYGYIAFYKFDLINNIFIQKSYSGKIEDGKEDVFIQYYNCFWYK